MSEYYMTHTGLELDEAISKVKSGYVMPTEIINIVSNVSNMDITNGKTLNVNINSDIPDGYIIPSGNSPTITSNGTHNVRKYENAVVNVPVKYFGTGVVTNVTAGQQLNVTGIRDIETGEIFTPKGLACFICPTETKTYTTSGSKPGVVMFYKDSTVSDGVGIATFSSAYSVRINPNVPRDYLTISGNSFTYKGATATMYGLMAAERWRWIAWR